MVDKLCTVKDSLEYNFAINAASAEPQLGNLALTYKEIVSVNKNNVNHIWRSFPIHSSMFRKYLYRTSSSQGKCLHNAYPTTSFSKISIQCKFEQIFLNHILPCLNFYLDNVIATSYIWFFPSS